MFVGSSSALFNAGKILALELSPNLWSKMLHDNGKFVALKFGSGMSSRAQVLNLSGMTCCI